MERSPGPTFSIGELSRRSGVPVRTIRFYSDIGLVPATGRSDAGYRRYDADALARLEIARTLRELGFDLATVQQILDREVTLGGVAERHAQALDAQIRILRLRRAVLRAVAKRSATLEEAELMSKLAKLSEAERNRILAEYYDEVFGGLDIDPDFERQMRSVTPDLPDDPTAEQVEAWVELAELVRDPAFRQRVRQMAQAHSDLRAAGEDLPGDQAKAIETLVAERAAAAMAEGMAPDSPEAGGIAAAVVSAMRGDRPDTPELRAAIADRFALGADLRVERYWQLMGVINGWPPMPARVPAYEWVINALRAHPHP